MLQLEEMCKQDKLAEEQHKAEVAQLRDIEALVTVTNMPGEEAKGEEPGARESTEERESVTAPQTEGVTHNVESDPPNSAQQGGARKPVTNRGQDSEAAIGSGCASR